LTVIGIAYQLVLLSYVCCYIVYWKFTFGCSQRARIQFRLPDGSTINHIFDADDTLQAAWDFLVSVSEIEFLFPTIFQLCLTGALS